MINWHQFRHFYALPIRWPIILSIYFSIHHVPWTLQISPPQSAAFSGTPLGLWFGVAAITATWRKGWGSVGGFILLVIFKDSTPGVHWFAPQKYPTFAMENPPFLHRLATAGHDQSPKLGLKLIEIAHFQRALAENPQLIQLIWMWILLISNIFPHHGG
jgi:hypothetical protein